MSERRDTFRSQSSVRKNFKHATKVLPQNAHNLIFRLYAKKKRELLLKKGNNINRNRFHILSNQRRESTKYDLLRYTQILFYLFQKNAKKKRAAKEEEKGTCEKGGHENS